MILPELSILIPSLFERKDMAGMLQIELNRQATGRPVEILMLIDNRKRSTGLKRQALLDMAQGHYIVHLDDDDWIAPNFVTDILLAIEQGDRDVIVYNQQSNWNGENDFIVRCGLEYENEGIHKDPEGKAWQDIVRKPWHWCCWNARIAKAARFPDGYIDDDWFWLQQTIAKAHTQYRIDKVLHFYSYRSNVSASGQGKPTT